VDDIRGHGRGSVARRPRRSRSSPRCSTLFDLRRLRPRASWSRRRGGERPSRPSQVHRSLASWTHRRRMGGPHSPKPAVSHDGAARGVGKAGGSVVRVKCVKGTSAEAGRVPLRVDSPSGSGCGRTRCAPSAVSGAIAAHVALANGSAAENSAGIAIAAATECWAARAGCRVALLRALAERTATPGRQRRGAARRHCWLFGGLRAHRVHVGVIAAEGKQRFSAVSGYEGKGARNTSN
jgi:hypothetical protein